MSATELKKEESMTAVESSQLGGTETILVAEDDAQTRRLYNAIFQQQGYKVILAQDGEEAIKKFIENKEEIQLVLLEI
jgi:DNA-binding response OmpR family regulator